MKPFGIAFVIFGLLAPLIWLPGIAPGRDLGALFSQYLGMAALIAMAFSQIIATRIAGIEAIFGALDQSYRLHKWLGIGAMIALLLHDTIDAEMDELGGETALQNLADTAGEVGLYGLLILVTITIATFIPYHLWRWTHRLIGIFFVLGAFHYFFILKPFDNTDPLGLYMAVVCGLGILSYLYTSFLRTLRAKSIYRISKIAREGQALAIEMVSTRRPIKYHAGQFAFFDFPDIPMAEPHPFTISSAPTSDNTLRITIAALGDFTTSLARRLKEGQTVNVEGPFGHFGRVRKKNQVWVAGGIGITPFVAMAEALKDGDGPVTLFCSVRDRESAAHLPHLIDMAEAKDNLSLIVWESRTQGRINADKIIDALDGRTTDTSFLYCGPTGLKETLAAGLARHGVAQRDFHYELFEIRTGIGLRRLADWLWERGKELSHKQKK